MSAKKIFTFISLVVILYSCTSNDNEKQASPAEAVDTVTTAVPPAPEDTNRTIVNRSLIWSVTPDDKSKDKLTPPADDSKLKELSSVQLVEMLNQNFPDIKMDLKRVSHDTMYVRIPNSNHLSNEVGNTGAYNYLASATYTLTELINIKYVNIEMEPGDHAEPGVYSRDDFQRLR